MATLVTEYLRHDPAHCLAPGLFRALQRGERRRAKLDLPYRYGGTTLRFLGFSPLGADDLRVLQALVAMAGQAGATLPAQPTTDIGATLRQALGCTGLAAGAVAVEIEASTRQVLAEMGLRPGGRQATLLRACLLRLATVTLHALGKGGAAEATTHLLSWARHGDQLAVALNSALPARSWATRRNTRASAWTRCERSGARRRDLCTSGSAGGSIRGRPGS